MLVVEPSGREYSENVVNFLRNPLYRSAQTEADGDGGHSRNTGHRGGRNKAKKNKGRPRQRVVDRRDSESTEMGGLDTKTRGSIWPCISVVSIVIIVYILYASVKVGWT
jgi:hypothetical protein